MQKIIATFVVSLLLVPAGSFAQNSNVDNGSAMGRGHDSTAPRGTLRESAIRQARQAAGNGAGQTTQTAAPADRPSLWSGARKGALWGAAISAGAGFAGGLAYCADGEKHCGEWVAVASGLGALAGAMDGALIGLIVTAIRRR